MAQERILISSDWGNIAAELADNAATRSLVEMLPLAINMRDHLRQEKTGYLPSPLPVVARQLDFSTGTLGLWGSAYGRYCCKSLFASLNTNFPGRGCGALTTMWGTTLGTKLTGDLGNAPEGTSTNDYCLFPPLAGNLSFGILGLLQQYRPI